MLLYCLSIKHWPQNTFSQLKNCLLLGLQLEKRWCATIWPPCCLFGWYMSVCILVKGTFFVSSCLQWCIFFLLNGWYVQAACFGRGIWTEILGFQSSGRFCCLLSVCNLHALERIQLLLLHALRRRPDRGRLSFVNYRVLEGNLTLIATPVFCYTQFSLRIHRCNL